MKIIKQNYLDKLNDKQLEAVINPDGPCLIVAGAGSGKTKVLTTRVVHIIKEKKAWPNQILCATFTNKAAREMQVRISLSLNEKVSSLPWLGTFHSVSAKILRRHADAVGLNSRFTIIDQEDQLRLMDEKYIELRNKLDWTRNQSQKEVRKIQAEANKLRVKWMMIAGSTDLIEFIL